MEWCQQFGFDFDSNEIFIRRVIEKSGKSRAWINGHNTSVNQVKEIGEWLMEIHSQNAYFLESVAKSGPPDRPI